jgi:hypothetical protein
MRATLAATLLLASAFCAYGFIAAGEPGPNHVYFRVGYAVIGIVCLIVAVILARKTNHPVN